MNFGNDIFSYDVERIADLKSMAEYGKRTIKRLQDELKEVQQIIEKQMLMIDNINNLFATTKASTYCTNEQSIIYQTLSKESNSQKKDSTSPEIIEPIGNLYNYPQTNEIISALKNAVDFQIFFSDFPIAFVALFDQSPIQFNTDDIILEVETWPTDKRINFFTSFFEHLNSVAFFLSSLLLLVDCQSIPTMSEYLETGFSTIFNCAKVAFFMYDSEENELIMEKHQLQMRMQITSGIIFESLQKNKLSLVSRGFEKISNDDLSLLKKNHVILSIPVYCNTTPTALLLLYDKIGGFRQYDYIIGQTLAEFISQAISVILMRQDRKKVSKMLNESLDSFLQLVSAKDLKSFLQILPITFSHHFQCQTAKIFQVSEDGQLYSEITEEGSNESFPINEGIIGLSISQREPVNVTNPEFSQSFCVMADRSDPSIMTKSILVCPILVQNENDTNENINKNENKKLDTNNKTENTKSSTSKNDTKNKNEKFDATKSDSEKNDTKNKNEKFDAAKSDSEKNDAKNKNEKFDAAKSDSKKSDDLVCRFAVALFNKVDLDSFTDLDVAKAKIVCENLGIIVASLLSASTHTASAESSQQTVAIYNTLFDMLAAISEADSPGGSLAEVASHVKKSLGDRASVDLFYVDSPYELVVSQDERIEKKLTSPDHDDSKIESDPIVHITRTMETKELSKEANQTVLAGLRSARGEPAGVIKFELDKINRNLSAFKSLSAFQSSTSFLSQKSNSSANYNKNDKCVLKDLNDRALKKIVSFWAKLVGPVLDMTIKKKKIGKLIRLCDNLIENLPSDPFLAVTVFNDLQFMLNSNTDDHNIEDEGEFEDNFEMTLIDKNDDFYQRTRDLIVSFSLLLASSENSNNSDNNNNNNNYKDAKPPEIDLSRFDSLLNDSKFDVFQNQTDFINSIIISAFEKFGVLDFLSVDTTFILLLIVELRSMHKSAGFKTWELAVDHFQFAVFLIQSLGKKVLLTIEEKTALLFYLLALYSIPYLEDPEMTLENPIGNSDYTPNDLLTKYYIENGREMSPLSAFVAAVAIVNNDQISIEKDVIDIIAPIMNKLDSSQSFEFLNMDDLCVFIACIAQYSYLARAPDVSKRWINLRIKEEFDENDEDEDEAVRNGIMMSQVDFELKSIVMPIFGELVKREIKVDHIRKLFTNAVSNINGNSS